MTAVVEPPVRDDSPRPRRARPNTRVAARLAIRSIRTHRGRSALIALMIAIPITGLVGVATVYTSLIPTVDETITTTLGQTQAQLTVVSPPDPTLEQNPFQSTWTQYAYDENGPTGFAPTDSPVAPSTWLPANTEILSLRTSAITVETASGIGSLTAISGDSGDSRLTGHFARIQGRAPVTDDEIEVSPAALDRLGAAVGDRVHAVEPLTREFTIVGVLRDLTSNGGVAMIFGRDGALDGVTADADPTSSTYYLPDTVVPWQDVPQYNANGTTVFSREVFRDPPSVWNVGTGWQPSLPFSGLLPLIVLIAAFALFQVGLLAGAAFLVGTRADMRGLATVASVGADSRVIFRSVTFGGVAIGIIGGAAGLALGVIGAAIAFTVINDGNATVYPGFHVYPLVLGGILIVAVLSGWIATLASARMASRVDIVLAMRGARQPARPSKLRVVASGTLAIGGAALTLIGGALTFAASQPPQNNTLLFLALALLAMGALVLQVAVILVIPAILRLFARVFGRSIPAARLAARDAARNSGRSVPVLASVMTTVFLAAFIMTMLASGQAATAASWTTSAAVGVGVTQMLQEPAASEQERAATVAKIIAVIDSSFRGSTSRAIGGSAGSGTDQGETVQTVEPRIDPALNCGSYDPVNGQDVFAGTPCEGMWLLAGQSFHSRLSVAEPDDIELVIGQKLSTQARRTLTDGGAVSVYPQFVDASQQMVLEWRTRPPVHDVIPDAALDRTTAIPAVSIATKYPMDYGAFITPATARALGIPYTVTEIASKLDGAPTQAQYDAFYAAASVEFDNPGAIAMFYSDNPPAFAGPAAWLLVAIAALIMIASSSVAIGLSRSDARRDDEVLDAIGSPPRLRRAIAFWQAIVVAGIGAIAGTAIALVPNLVLSLQYASDDNADVLLPLAPPWLQLGVTAVGVPLLIAILSWVMAGRRRVAVRRAA